MKELETIKESIKTILNLNKKWSTVCILTMCYLFGAFMPVWFTIPVFGLYVYSFYKLYKSIRDTAKNTEKE